MRRLVVVAALLLSASPARAAGPQVTDPAGDANGAGVVAPAASLAAFDVTAVRWWADAAAQRVSVTFSGDHVDPGRYVLSWSTPTCASSTLEWTTGATSAYLAGCLPRQRRWPAAPSWSGRTLTFSIPRGDLPSWLAEGTTIRALGATAGPVVDVVVGELQPVADTASADVPYVVGR
jgi:hypothetical protein